MGREPAEQMARRLTQDHDLSINAEEAATHIRLARVAGIDEPDIEDMICNMGRIKTATDDEQAENQGILVHEMPDDVFPDDVQ